MSYKCKRIVCGAEYTVRREVHPLLQICKDCRNTNQDLVKRNTLEVNRIKRGEKEAYWKEHPGEYEEYLKARKAKTVASKIAKYGSLENAEKARKEKQRETLMAKYPDEDWEHITNVGQIAAVKKRIAESNADRDQTFYDERQKKTNATRVRKYGSLENAYATMTGKVRTTMEERYGVSSPFQLESTKEASRRAAANDPEFYTKRNEKTRETKMAKYGSLENAYASMSRKTRETCLERYGETSASKLDSVKDKAQQTWRKRCEEDPDFLSNIQKKSQETKIAKYGSLEEAQKVASEKRTATCLEKYGTPTALDSSVVQERVKATLMERYGVDNIAKVPESRVKASNTIIERYGSWRNVKTQEQWDKKKQEILRENLEKYHQFDFTKQGFEYHEEEGIPYVKCLACGHDVQLLTPPSHLSSLRCEACNPFYTASAVENYIRNTIESWGIEVVQGDRTVLHGKELDMYIPSHKLAIEYDGCWWHRYKEYSKDPVGKTKHLDKTEACAKAGIQLIHIFDEEFHGNEALVFDLIRKRLNLAGTKVMARKCVVRALNNSEYKGFVEANHFQGHSPASVRLGLFNGDELVAVMSFTKSRYAKDYEWELSRYCEKQGLVVLGGKEKLLKHFERQFQPESMISYCDRRWFTGTSYLKMGFTLDHVSPPNYKYFKSGYYKFYSRIQFQKHKLKDIEGFDFDENLSEMENMWNNGYSVIYDCGNLVFTKKY